METKMPHAIRHRNIYVGKNMFLMLIHSETTPAINKLAIFIYISIHAKQMSISSMSCEVDGLLTDLRRRSMGGSGSRGRGYVGHDPPEGLEDPGDVEEDGEEL